MVLRNRPLAEQVDRMKYKAPLHVRSTFVSSAAEHNEKTSTLEGPVATSQCIGISFSNR